MKKTLAILTLAMMGFGGYIGYSTNYVEPATANEVIIPRFVDVPRTTGFNLDINLNKNTVTCNSTEQDVKIKIERKDSIVYKTRIITKEKIKYVKVREIPPFLLPKSPTFSEMLQLDKLKPDLCKIEPNLERIQH